MSLVLPVFNPLQFASRLKKAGVPEQQADVQAEALREAFEERDHAVVKLAQRFDTQQQLSKIEAEQLATKGDVFAVKTDVLKLDAKIDLVQKEIELVDQRSQSRFKFLYWLMGALVASLFAVAAALKVYFGA